MMRFSSVLLASAVLGFGCNDSDTDDGDDDDDNVPTDTDTDLDTDTTSVTTGIECGTDGVGLLTGTITDDLTLGPDCNWLIRGAVTIGDDVNETVLTILPGAQLYGEGALTSFLAIARGS